MASCDNAERSSATSSVSLMPAGRPWLLLRSPRNSRIGAAMKMDELAATTIPNIMG